MASIMNRNGRYTVRVRKAGSRPKTRTFDRLRDARLWAAKTESQSVADAVVEQHWTLGELLVRYGKEVTPAKRGRDVEAYVLGKLCRSWIADIALSKLTSVDVARYRDERLRHVGS